MIHQEQKLSVLDRTELASAEGVQRGGYVLWQSAEDMPDVILIGTGSEVLNQRFGLTANDVAAQARRLLREDNL